MTHIQKEITYSTTNSYATLNALTHQTEYIWLVCHGMGYLSRYFLKYFKGLDTQKHYIIAPQAPSKYYLNQEFKHVGANWLTRENTAVDTENIMNYFDAIFKAEGITKQHKLVIMGYSQGVSVAMRYMAKRQLQAEVLIIHSGSIPNELTQADFAYFNGSARLIYGTNDAYLNESRIKTETEKAQNLFGEQLEIVSFEGAHEVNTSIINNISDELVK